MTTTIDPQAGRAAARHRHPSARRARPPAGRRSGPFILILVTVTFLSLLGLLMVLSASSISLLDEGQSAWQVFRKQTMWLGVGVVALVAGVRLDYHALQRVAYPGLLVSIGLLVLVNAPGLGIEVNGSTRWIGVGELRLQPSELTKLFLVLTAADFCSRPGRSIHDTRTTLRPVVVLYLTVAFLLFLQPDLGTLLITGGIVACTLFASGIRLTALGSYAAAGASLGAAGTLMAGYRRERLFAVQDPWADELGSGWQLLQGLTSIANGGATGLGLGASRGKWGYLPFAHSDFIYAVIAEELGFIGAVGVLWTYLAIGVLALVAALRAPDLFGRMIAAGIGSWILIQAFVNVGGVLGILPITGIPLPFVSYGGTSLVVMMAAIGILLNIARQGRRG